MQYHYVAYNLEEGIVKGRLEARDEFEARGEVEKQGLKTLRLRKVWQPPTMEDLFPSFYAVKEAKLIAFTRQLSTMVSSGASLDRTLQMLQAEAANPVMERVLGEILEKVGEGDTLSSAMAQYPNMFDRLYVSIVEIGEFTGRLAPALDDLADMMESSQEAKQRIVKSMMMPLFQVGMAVLMVGLNVFVLLPPLFESFEEDQIPIMMKVLLGGADYVKANPIPVFGVLAALIVTFVSIGKVPSLAIHRDRVKLKLPLMGALSVSSEIARFSRTMGMLLGSGVSLADSLQMGIGSTGNLAMRRAFEDAEQSLVMGGSLTEALRRHSVLPHMWVELVNIGEESNTLGTTMNELANSYQKKLESQINAILAILEPLSTLMVGGIVIFLAMSMLQPIMGQMESFSAPP